MLHKIFRMRVLVGTGAVVGIAAIALVATGLVRTSAGSSAALEASRSDSSTTTAAAAPTTTTTIDPRVLVQPAAAALPPLPPGGLGGGSSGPEVQAYQQRLADLHFDPGAIDGQYGPAMTYAVETLQKIMGVEANGTLGEPERQALAGFSYPTPLQADGEANRTEIDVTKQVLTLYEHYQVRLVTTVSTGSGESYCSTTPRDNPTRRVCEKANTPSGRFTFREYRDGWDRSPLGRLFNPFYFNGGIAVHGYESVPTTPASHGCVRIPMHIADYFHTLVKVGDPVYVFGGTDAQVLSSTAIAPPAPAAPPPDPAAPAPAPPAAVAPTPVPPPTSTPPASTPTVTP